MNINPIMLARKVNIKNINPQNLGYVLKDGTINFQSESSAFNFARNIVNKALEANKPFERLVIWKNSQVHLIADGTTNKVIAGYSKEKMPKGVSSMHGHISDLPPSIEDYVEHFAHNMNVSYVLCPSGKYSKITTLPGENINKASTRNKINQMCKKSKIVERNLNLQLQELFPPEQVFNLSFKSPQNPNESCDYWQSFVRKCLKKTLTITKNCRLDMWEKNSGKKSGVIFETTLDKTASPDTDVERYVQILINRMLKRRAGQNPGQSL